MTKYKLLIYFTIIFFVSCNDTKKEPEKNEYEIRQDKQDQLDTLNQKEAIRISNINNAIIGWDTTEQYSYALQELFLTKHHRMSFTGTINDIIKKDSFYILKVYNSNSNLDKNFNAEITVTASAFEKFHTILKEKNTTDGCFILDVTHISSNSPILSSEVDPEGDNVEDATSHITFDFDETLITFKGNLIDYFLYDQAKDEN